MSVLTPQEIDNLIESNRKSPYSAMTQNLLDTIDHLRQELATVTADAARMSKQIDANDDADAVKAERERCAKIANSYMGIGGAIAQHILKVEP